MNETGRRPGLRERQRLAVEAELRETALRLFEERGFDAVSVAEVAAAAGMSERTFFRYFPTKEDVVLTVLEGFGLDVVSRLESVPLDRPWFEILRETYTTATSVDITMDGERGDYVRHFAGRVYRLAQSSARLRAGLDARARVAAADVAEIIARRSGLDLDEDPRPRVWATVVIAAMNITVERHVAVGSVSTNVAAEAFDALGAVFAEPEVRRHTSTKRVTRP